jgi:ell wall binding domain 2 (CWB2)/Nidogen-like/HYR domain/Carboxypeptidase regulatory-like domain
MHRWMKRISGPVAALALMVSPLVASPAAAAAVSNSAVRAVAGPAPSAGAAGTAAEAAKAAKATKAKPVAHPAAIHLKPAKIVTGRAHTMPLTGHPAGSGAASPTTVTIPPTAAQNLNYYNGPIMQRTTTYLVFWAPGTAVINPAVKQLDQQFLTDLGGPYYNILDQYYELDGSTKTAIAPLTSFGGAWSDSTNPYPATGPVTTLSVEKEIENAIAANPGWNAPSLTTLYEVVLGQSVVFCAPDGTCDNDPANGFCAFHGAFTDSANFGASPVVFTDLGNNAARGGCQSSITDPPNGTELDSDVSTMSHETFEAISDPLVETGSLPSGSLTQTTSWANSEGSEIADLCLNQYGVTSGANLTMGGHQYLVQEEWSNQRATAAPAKAYGGCVVASGAIEPASSHPACTANTLTANDDGSTSAVTLPFTANFFSAQYTSLYVNNNGNVTFDGPQSTYTPYGLQDTNREIIAPFFADVDTRGPGSGLVTYGGDTAHNGQPAYFCVDWINVGYYDEHVDFTNSFQLLLIDRSGTTGTAGDFDIEFNYDKIQWETGDASGGIGGQGGSPAVVGYSSNGAIPVELQGSAMSGSLEDGKVDALIQGGQNSSIPGRYIFPVRNGATPQSGVIHGVVTDHGNPVAESYIQICPDSGTCYLTGTTSSGVYSVTGLPPGGYSVIANPPYGSTELSGGGVATLPVNGDVEVDIALTTPIALPAGVTVSHTRLTGNGIPVLNANLTNALSATACTGGTVSAVLAPANGAAVTVPMAASGTAGVYTGTIPLLRPVVGSATVTISATCPNSAQNQSIVFNVYIDPSGTVVDQNGVPIAGATVTLLRSDDQSGPYTPVPDGSSLMSPANQADPDTTGSDGTFGWDVLTGYYKVQASAPGCTDPADPTSDTVTSAAFAVPPPMTDLQLTLSCSGATVSPPAITASPVSLEGNTTGGYTGTIGGITVTDPSYPVSDLTITNDAPTLLPLGQTTVHYTVTDPVGNTATATQTVTVADTTAPSITCPAAVSGPPGTAIPLGTPTVHDVVDAHPTVTDNAPALFPAGTTTVTWTATDHSGNHASCGQQVLAQTPKSTVRLAGSNAIGTAIAISQYDFADNGTATDDGHDGSGRIQAQAVVLSRSDEFYDALAGSALAAQKKGPLLITAPTALNAQINTEIKRILPAGGTVYLLGGLQALSQTVQGALQAEGYTTVRFAGSNLYDTATLIDQAISPHPGKVIVATGLQYYDALSAGAAAGATPGTVVVLTDGTTMPAISATYLDSLSPAAAYGAGGPGNTALANALKSGQVTWSGSVTVHSEVGATAPDTSLLLAGAFFTHPSFVAVATDKGWYDALTGGAAAGFQGGPLLLTAPTSLYGPDAAYISSQSTFNLDTAAVLGGPAALPATVFTQISAALGQS